ncbi:LamG-like jellyroll fold domain-containing protein [uncultured Fibrella sp.]|uniref:LamG-like jellyroll fold domain-containing protein n=1 Tax=uncultured Fibrella sp. TaxID=1284596 RepID=UPI0035C98954
MASLAIVSTHEEVYYGQPFTLRVVGCDKGVVRWTRPNGTIVDFANPVEMNSGPGWYRADCFGAGFSTQATKFIEESAAQVADITADREYIFDSEYVNLVVTGCTVNNIEWELAGLTVQNFQTSTNQNTFRVQGAGTFRARCRTSDNPRGLGPWSTVVVGLKTPAVVDITANKDSANIGEPVLLTGSGCTVTYVQWQIAGKYQQVGVGSQVVVPGPGTYYARCYASDRSVGPWVSYKVRTARPGKVTIIPSRYAVSPDETVTLKAENCPNGIIGWIFPSRNGLTASEPLTGNPVDGVGPGEYKAYCIKNGYTGPVASITIAASPTDAPRFYATKSSVRLTETADLLSEGCPNNSVQWRIPRPGGGYDYPVGRIIAVTGPAVYSGRCLSGPYSSWVDVQIFPAEQNALRLTANKSSAKSDEEVIITAYGCNTGTIRWMWGENSPVGKTEILGQSQLTKNGPGTYKARCEGDPATNGSWVQITIHPTDLNQFIPSITLSKSNACPDEPVTITAAGCPAGYSVQLRYVRDEALAYWKDNRIVAEYQSTFDLPIFAYGNSPLTLNGPRTVWARCFKVDGSYTGDFREKSATVDPRIFDDFYVSSNGPLQVGQKLLVGATLVDGGTYSWTGPDGFNSSAGRVINIEHVTLANAGLYKVTVTAGTGGATCSKTAEVNVVVKNCDLNIQASYVDNNGKNVIVTDFPAEGISVVPPLTLKALDLTNRPFQKTDVNLLKWTFNGSELTKVDSLLISPNSTLTTYTIARTDKAGCTDQVAVKLKPVACSTLVATATPNTLLMGQQTILTVNNTLGKAGNGLVMDGATNTFTTNQQPNLALHSNFTWEAWVKPGKPRSLNAENENYALYPSYQANTNDAGRTGMGVAVGTDGITVVEHGPNLLRGIVALDMDINQWTHVAITYTNNLPRIYVNGKLRATANTSSGRVAMPGLGVGGGDDNRYGRFKGSIDEVRIWNTPRSAQQISADYYKTFETANLPAGLVTYWNFDNAANGTATAILPANVAAGLGGATVADGALLIEEDRQLTTAYEWSLNGSVLANTATLLHEPQQSGTYQVRCINCQTACATSVAVTVTRFDGCFRLAAKHSGKVMYPGLDNTIKVQPLNTDSKDQVWALQPAGSGSFRLISAVNGKAVQYYNGSSLSLVPVSQTLAQQFSLVPQAEANTYRLDPLDLVNIDANNPLATPQPHSVEATDDGLWAPLTTGGTNQFFVLSPATCPFTLPADCGIRLVATDATGKETDRLPRKAGTTDQFDPLTIRAESLSDTPLTGALYSWSLASGAPSNASSLTATQRGVYSLTLSAAGQTSVCQTNITLSATPCSSQTAPYGECKNVNLTAPANTVGTARLFVGDSFNAGDYVVRITDLSGGASGWSGKGTVSMTLFGGLGLPVSVIFANAVINDCLEMVGGSVTTQYDPAWSNIVPIDLFTDLFKDLSDQLKAAYQNYKGSDADKVKIRELNTRYEAALADDALTEEQKQRLKAEYDAYKQQSEALLNCTQPTGCPTADQLSQRVDDLQKIADDIAEENKPNPNALRSGKLPAIAEQTLSGGRGNACQESVRLTTNLTIQFLNNKCWLKSDGYLEIDGVKYVVVWKDDEPPTQFLGFYRLDYMRKNACSNPTSETIATVDKKANYPICQQGWYPPSGYKKVFDLSPINTILAADVAGNSAVKLLRESGLLSKDQNTVGNSVSNRYTILVSDYTFSPTDLEVIAQKANNPGSDEIILWIHFPTQNVATTKYQWFLGTNIKRKMTPATTEWTALLDGWIQNLAKVAHNQHVPSFEKVISNIVVSLGQVQVPAEFWDCTSPDYSPIMATIYASDEERLKFAYKCGLFRGVMGQIAGTADAAVTLSKFQNELPRFLLDITFNKDNIREELRAKVSRMLSLGPIKDMYDNLVLQHTSKTSCALAEQVGKDVVDVVAVALAVRSAVKLGAQGLSQLMTRITDDIAPLVAPYRNIPKVYFPDKGGFDITPGRTTPPGTPPSPGSGGMLVELKAPSIGTRPVAHFAIRQAQPMPAEQLAMNRQIAKSVGAKTPAAVAAEGELLTEQLPGRVYEMGSDGGSYSTYVDLGKGRLYKIRAAKPAPATGMVDVVVAVEEGKPAVQPLATSDGGVVVATLTKDGDCDLCKQRTQNDQDLCDKVTAVAAKATNQTKAKQAMEEFCKQPIAELPTSDLKSIVGQLQSDVTARSLTTFSQDVISRTSREAAFANNLSKFRDRQVAGWLILEEALTTYPQDDNGSDAILRKTYDAILYATEAYNFLHADRDRVKSRMVNKLRSGNVSKFAYLTSLAAIATTSDPNDPAITKLAPTRAAAFEIALNSDGCSGDFAVPGTTVDADFTQNPAMLTIQAARDDARKTYRGAPTGVNMNKISLESEKAGMLAADLFFTVSDGYRPLACEVPGGGKQGEFDRVFGKYDGQGRLLELVIVECKGGSSTLGCRNRNQQGSTKYLLDVVDYMNSQVPNDNSLLRQTTDLLLVNVGKIRGVKVPVRYMLINQAFNEGGDLKKALVTHFILNQSLFE